MSTEKVRCRHCNDVFRSESEHCAHQRDGHCPVLVMKAIEQERRYEKMRAKKDAEDKKRGIDVEARNRARAAAAEEIPAAEGEGEVIPAVEGGEGEEIQAEEEAGGSGARGGGRRRRGGGRRRRRRGGRR